MFTCGACLEIVFKFEWRATYFGSLRVKLFLAPLGMPRYFDPQGTGIECSLIKASHYLQRCTKVTEHGRYSTQNNQLLTKCHSGLENNCSDSRFPKLHHHNHHVTTLFGITITLSDFGVSVGGSCAESAGINSKCHRHQSIIRAWDPLPCKYFGRTNLC